MTKLSKPHPHPGPWGGDDVLPALSLVLSVPDDDDWKDKALCAQTDPEVFFPEKGGTTREAKQTCLACEVRQECLEYALTHGERYGIWGGKSERERRAMSKTIAGTPRTRGPARIPEPTPISLVMPGRHNRNTRHARYAG